MKKLLLLLVFIHSLSLIGLAHSGKTDENGGHWDHKKGTYHYHNEGESSIPWGTLLATGLVGGGGYAVYSRKKKKKEEAEALRNLDVNLPIDIDVDIEEDEDDSLL